MRHTLWLKTFSLTTDNIRFLVLILIFKSGGHVTCLNLQQEGCNGQSLTNMSLITSLLFIIFIKKRVQYQVKGLFLFCPLTSELVRKISTALFLLSTPCVAICRRKVSSARQYSRQSPKPRKPAGMQPKGQVRSGCTRATRDSEGWPYSPSCFTTLADAFTWAFPGRGGNLDKTHRCYYSLWTGDQHWSSQPVAIIMDEVKYWLWLPECRALRPVRTDAAAAIQSHRRSGGHGTPPYPSATDTADTSTWLPRGLLFHPLLRPAACRGQLFSHLFRYNQEGEHVPVFHHLWDLHVVAVDAQSRPHGFFFLLE